MNVLPPISTVFVHTVPHRRRVELTTTTRLSLLRLRLPKSLSSSASPAVYTSPNNHHFRRLPTLAGLGHVSILSKLMEGTADTGSANGGVGSSAAARVSSLSNGGEGEDSVVQFTLSPSSALKIQKGDITRWFVDGSSDAIVNPANERMLGGGGADGAIHRAAGPELRAACYNVPEVRPEVRCPTGEARITLGFRLSASHVIHTVGPVYDVDVNPEASLRNAYRNSLRLAKDNNIQYIAFPAISCGVYRYPFEEAATVAISTVKEFANDFKEVHFVLFFDDLYNIWLNKVNELLQDQSAITTAQQLAVFSEEAECTGWNEM